MAIPRLKEVLRAGFGMDGDQFVFTFFDDSASMHRLELVQHTILQNSTPERTCGRLYFDDRLTDVRSDDEAALINFLQQLLASPVLSSK
jgi:hypothetical protein